MKCLVILSMVAMLPASAATFNVNSTADMPDAIPGNGVCLAVNSKCTLRSAIEEANKTAASDSIQVVAGTYALTLGELKITTSMTIRGANVNTTIIDAGRRSRAFSVSAGKVVQILMLTVRNGLVRDQDGGCISNAGQLTLTTVVVSACVVKNTQYDVTRAGGGIVNLGKLTLQSCQVTKNSLEGLGYGSNKVVGGGIASASSAQLKIAKSTVSSNGCSNAHRDEDCYGGGVFNMGSLEVTESTMRDNTTGGAFGTGGLHNSGTGKVEKSTVYHNTGGTTAAGGIFNNRTLTVVNSTVSGNIGAECGGFWNAGILTLQNATVYANRSSYVGGVCGWATVNNSIIAGNIAGDSPDCDAGMEYGSLTYSLIGNTKGCTLPAGGVGNRLNVNPMLMPLTSNGGSTQTHALLAGSLALDSGSPAATGKPTACEKTDQRGVVRPQGVRCDMGAYERRPGVPHSGEVEGGMDSIRDVTEMRY